MPVFIKHGENGNFQRLSTNPNAGYTSKRNMQATLLWRWKRTKPHDPSWLTTPSRAYKTDDGVDIYKWSNTMEKWRFEASIIWKD